MWHLSLLAHLPVSQTHNKQYESASTRYATNKQAVRLTCPYCHFQVRVRECTDFSRKTNDGTSVEHTNTLENPFDCLQPNHISLVNIKWCITNQSLILLCNRISSALSILFFTHALYTCGSLSSS